MLGGFGGGGDFDQNRDDDGGDGDGNREWRWNLKEEVVDVVFVGRVWRRKEMWWVFGVEMMELEMEVVKLEKKRERGRNWWLWWSWKVEFGRWWWIWWWRSDGWRNWRWREVGGGEIVEGGEGGVGK